MNCPKCARVLAAQRFGPVQVDECPGCRGIWFDADELGRAKDHSQPDANWLDFEVWTRGDQVRGSAATLRCPACGTALVALRYGDDPAVELDHCPACRGTWLDSGEFKKLVDGLARELDTKSRADYVRAALAEAREILTGPEGVVSEWRDFTTVLRLLQYRFLVENPRAAAAIAAAQQTIR
jgi:Zn-finger nucleic acid-binding protein